MAFTDGNIIIGTSVDVGGIGTGLAKIEKSFKKLGKLAAFGLGIKALTGLGEAALDAASDLQEVQNVVDVSFKKLDEQGNVISDMTYKIEAFADTCIEKFGMSEFAAKSTAGSFMAMGKSMGLSMEEASTMAVKLTGLTGDFASFYNITQDYARVAMSAVYTGETETLKRYGIVLTEANLQQYATAQGIETTVKKMDARDKAILRYMYIMNATKDMEGDFVRTQDSWANSTRVLSQLWNQFLVELGNGLISVLTPLVQVLGQVVQRLTQFVQVLWQALSNIFGFKLQDVTEQAKGAASGIGDMSDSVDELGNSIDKAGKKAKKQLANFDELNNITTPSSSDTSGGGAGLSLGDLDMDVSGLWDPTAKGSPWSDIDNLYDLGKWVGDKLCAMMESIDWNKIYQKAKNFGKGLAQFLNGLISTDLFKDLGHTIASALNTAIYAALAFGQEFDWTQFGLKLAAGINEFFTTFDFASLAKAINVWVQGIYELIKTTIANISWKDVFKGIKDFVTNLDLETFMIITGFFVLKKLFSKAMFTAFTSGLAEGLGMVSLGSVLKNAVGQLGLSLGIGISNLGSTISYALRYAFVSAFGFLTKTLPQAIGGFFSKIGGVIKNLMNGWDLAGSIDAMFGSGASTIAATVSGIISIVAGAIIAVKNFIDMLINGWDVLSTIFEAIGIALAVIGAILLGAEAAVAAVIGAIVFAVSQLVIVIKDNWDAIVSWFAGIGEWIMNNVINPIIDGFTWLGETIMAIIEPIISFFEGLFLRIGQFAEGCWILIQAIWMVVSDWFVTYVIDPVVGFFQGLWDAVSGFFRSLWETIKGIWNAVSTWFNTYVIQPIVSFFSPIVTKIAGFFSNLWNKIKSVWNTVASWFSRTVIEPIKKAWSTAIDAIAGFFTKLWDGITSGVKAAMNGVIYGIESAINWIVRGINKIISGFNSVVSWGANLIGIDWGGVSLVPEVKLPRLAKGAVIPPNNEFLAVLGDQKSGTNIEAPLDTIKKAFMETLAAAGGMGQGEKDDNDIVINIDGNEIFRVVRKQSQIFTKSTGVPAF